MNETRSLNSHGTESMDLWRHHLAKKTAQKTEELISFNTEDFYFPRYKHS